MNRAIAIFLSMLQSLDVTWRVFVTFLTAVIVVCLTLFVFLPLFLALLKLLLRFLQKTLLGATNFCMKTWGKLVIRSRKKTSRFPQFLVSAEDFAVRIITSVYRFFDRIIRWNPPYGAISVRVVLVSCILLVLLTAALWVIPGSSRTVAAVYTNWEREYLISTEESGPVVLFPAIKENVQVYYQLSKSAVLREAPDGEEVKKLTDKSIVLRYLGKTEKQWLKVEYAEENQAVRGWLHESAVSRWRPRKNSFEYIKPGSSLRLSASGVPIFTCKFIGFEKAGDGTIHIILKE